MAVPPCSNFVKLIHEAEIFGSTSKKDFCNKIGTFLPVSGPLIYDRCQGNTCHRVQVRLLCAQELPLWTPVIFGCC